MVQSNKPRIQSPRSRSAAAADLESKTAKDSEVDSEPVEALRQQAEMMGYNLMKTQRPRQARPPTKKGGRIQTTYTMTVEIREALEAARSELNLTFSQIIERGIVCYLASQGITVPGFALPELPHLTTPVIALPEPPATT